MTNAMEIARERQLDWLLDEVLRPVATGALTRRAPASTGRWLAAAIAVFAVGIAIAVAVLERSDVNGVAPVLPPPRDSLQDPDAIDWHECHGVGGLDAVPADVVGLRCFDFDDDGLARLVRFSKLVRLDLSGMDTNAQGFATSLPITDAGVKHLAALTQLRWLSLASCHSVEGETLAQLRAIPRLEHLDLTYTGITSKGVGQLRELPSLRALVLSYCLAFHGRSLADVAKIPGLRRLELNGCATVSAKDAMHLAGLRELRHLDLRDCMGRFRGQTAAVAVLDDVTGEDPEPPPMHDGVGITDDVVAALSELPLETLRLGGCSALTDGIAPSIAKLTALRTLDLSSLPKTSGALLARVPNDLVALVVGHNPQHDIAALARLPALADLHTFGLSGFDPSPIDVMRLLQHKQLRCLRLGGMPARGKGGERTKSPPLTAEIAAEIAKQETLEELELRDRDVLEADAMARIAALPRLRVLDLTAPLQRPPLDRGAAVAALADNRSIQELRLIWCGLDADSLRALAELPLRQLDVYGSGLDNEVVREIAAAWPGCQVRLPKGQRYRVP